jgi:hypothetical protein
LATHSEVQISHGLCPECLEKYYPDAHTGEEPAERAS